MAKIDPSKPGDMKDSEIKLRCIANFANEATSILGSEQEQNEENTKQLLKRYRNALAITTNRFNHMAKEAKIEFRELSGGLIDKADKDSVIYLLYQYQKNEEEQNAGIENPNLDITQTLQIDPDEKPEEQITQPEPELQAENAEAILTEGLQEITSMLLEDEANLSQIFNVIIETVYRAFAYEHVILALHDRNRKEYCAKMGFGANIEKIIAQFHFPAKFSPNVFHAALNNDVDLYIEDALDKKMRQNIPEWHKQILQSGSFFIFPLVVKQRPLGLIYADHTQPNGVSLSKKQLNLIKALRNQLILAIKSRS
jgi:hypothetical protein